VSVAFPDAPPTTDMGLTGAQRMTAHVAAYHNGRTPDDGDPDEVSETEVWLEADGTVITDPARIDEVRAWIADYAKEQTNDR
jgi:hypothetical protein